MRNLAWSLFILFSIQTSAATLYSVADGDWTDNTIWSASSGGTSCSCVPNPSTDDIYVETSVNLNTSLFGANELIGNLTIQSSGVLSGTTNTIRVASGGRFEIISGGIVSIGSILIDQGSVFYMEPGSELTTTSNFRNANSSTNVLIDGYVNASAGQLRNGTGAVIHGNGTIDFNTGLFFNNGTINGTIVGSTIFLIGPLPIELSYFKAQEKDNSVFIAWETASESNNDYFVIERSYDGKKFETVAKIKGQGNSSISTQYEFTDVEFNKSVTTLYYRLLQFDFDGKNSKTGVVSVEIIKREPLVLLYPIPTKNILNIASQNEQLVKFELCDLSGKVMQSFFLNDTEIKLDVSSLNPGYYFLKTNEKTFKFIKD